MIGRAQLLRLTPQADAWLDPLNESMPEYHIDSDARVTMFLATCLYESNGLASLVENLNYSAAGLLRMWTARFTSADAEAYAHHPERIANRAYANRGANGDEASGDGWRYRGRGPIQCTFAGNYGRAEAATGYPLLAQPELLEQPKAGAAVSAWFWSDTGCNNEADANNFAGTQGIINRGNRSKIADNMPARILWLGKVRKELI